MAVGPHRDVGMPVDETLEDETGPLAMLPGEETIAESRGAAGAQFILTNQRVLHTGGAEDHVVAESARIADIVAVRLERRPRDRRSAIWGIIGVLAAVGVWQVTRNESVGAIAAAVVGFVSLALLADYWLRRPGIILTFVTPGGPVGGHVPNSYIDAAETFVGRFERQRAELARQTTHRPPFRPYGGVRHPMN